MILSFHCMDVLGLDIHFESGPTVECVSEVVFFVAYVKVNLCDCSKCCSRLKAQSKSKAKIMLATAQTRKASYHVTSLKFEIPKIQIVSTKEVKAPAY